MDESRSSIWPEAGAVDAEIDEPAGAIRWMADRGDRALAGVHHGMLDAGAAEDPAWRAPPRSPCRCRRIDRHAVRTELHAIRRHQLHFFVAHAAAGLGDRLGGRRVAAGLGGLPDAHQRSDGDVETAARPPRDLQRLVEDVVERRVDVDQSGASAANQLREVAVRIEVAEHVVQAHDLRQRDFNRPLRLRARRMVRRRCRTSCPWRSAGRGRRRRRPPARHTPASRMMPAVQRSA